MDYEFTLFKVTALVLSGLLAGFVNTLAGGGTLFTVPALMLLGLPADVANGTNRLGVFMQSLTAVHGYYKHQQLVTADLLPILMPTILGAIIGALTASFTPVTILKPVLLITMVGIALLIVFKPASIVASMTEQPRRLQDKPIGFLWLFVAGLYGGFVQAGVGFVLIAAFSGVLRYHLVQANALKMVCTMVFGGASVAIFALRGQVWWIPGMVLAASTMVGVWFTVRYSITASEKVLKTILLVMVTLVCAAAFVQS